MIDWRIGGRRQAEEVVPRRFVWRSADQTEDAGRRAVADPGAVTASRSLVFGFRLAFYGLALADERFRTNGDIVSPGFAPIVLWHPTTLLRAEKVPAAHLHGGPRAVSSRATKRKLRE